MILQIENISKELSVVGKNNNQLSTEILKLTENLKTERNDHYAMEQNFMDQVNKLEIKLKEVSQLYSKLNTLFTDGFIRR